jgi:hypothetical protein
LKTSSRLLLVTSLLFPLACAPGDSGPLVARADGHALTVDQAARLLSGVQGLPNDPEVVEALANLWIDYTLLAKAAAEDPTLRQVDLTILLDQQFEQEMVLALRDSVVRPDTAISDDELRTLFATGAPGARARASHILMQIPPQATPSQTDSVRRRMQDIADRVEAGEDFSALAREFSQDPGSASQGGDLGWFDRGEMVRPFEDAAFALEPGETSGIVQTPFGFHLIRTVEKEVPTFDDVQDDFRLQVQDDRYQQAESLFIAGLEEAASVEVVDGAAEIVRELARDTDQALGTRAGRRALVRYRGGTYTVREALEFMRTRQPQFLEGLANAPDEAIEDSFLKGLVQRKLLVTEAREAGLGPTPTQRDSVADLFRAQFLEVAETLGLHPLEVLGTETRAQAIDRVVEARLRAVVTGQAQMIPLAGIALALRTGREARVVRAGIDATVAQIARARGPQPAVPPATPVPMPEVQPVPPDTAGA